MKKKRKGTDFIPYRDSVLTWLLRENLGGNSKTAMIAAISPADINYEETLSTLRYADRAKQIMCTAVINEDANAKLIRELRDEIARLKEILRSEGIELSQSIENVFVDKDSKVIDQSNQVADSVNNNTTTGKSEQAGGKPRLTRGSVSLAGENAIEQLQETEKLMSELNATWEEKLARTEVIRAQREAVLTEMGVARRADGDAVGVFSPSDTPHLLNLNEDPLMSECLLYYLKDGYTRVGLEGAPVAQDVRLSGTNILLEHCVFENQAGHVTVIPSSPEAMCYVNGRRVEEKQVLRTGARVILGKYHVFRFQHPAQIREASAARAGDGIPVQQPVDWTFAQMELLEKQGIDLKLEMEQKLISLEEQYRREKAEADLTFEEAKKKYEQTIEQLQKQVNEQSMTMSQMFSSLHNTIGHGGGGDSSDNSQCGSETEHRRMFAEDSVFFALESEPPLTEWQESVMRKAIIKWRFHQFTSLRDDLWGNAIFLKEANAMSVELKKRVQFQFAILTENIYSPLSAELLADYIEESDSATTITSAVDDQCPFPKTIVAVEVKDQKNGATHYWSLVKLRSVIRFNLTAN